MPQETRWSVFSTSVRGWLEESRDPPTAGGLLPRTFPMQALSVRVCMHVVCHRCREDMRWTKYPTPPDLCSLCRQAINHFIPAFERPPRPAHAVPRPAPPRLKPEALSECVRASADLVQERDAALRAAAMAHGHLEELSRRWWDWLNAAQAEAVRELQLLGTPAKTQLDDASLSTALAVGVVRTQLELEVAAAQSGSVQRIRAMRQNFHWGEC